jgi:hypothetical protein
LPELPIERLQVAIGSVAAAQTAFDITLEFVKQRRAFGKPIGALQPGCSELREQSGGQMGVGIEAAQ